MTLRAALWFLLVFLVVGCSRESANSAVDRTAHAIDGDECAACGMIVREQPSPRAQAVHRDGERVFFCSIGESVNYLSSPSPHGALIATYVEVLAPDADPALDATERRPWVPADQATYVVGVARPRVMGEALLAYPTRAQAAAAAARFHGRVASWTQLTGNEALAPPN